MASDDDIEMLEVRGADGDSTVDDMIETLTAATGERSRRHRTSHRHERHVRFPPDNDPQAPPPYPTVHGSSDQRKGPSGDRKTLALPMIDAKGVASPDSPQVQLVVRLVKEPQTHSEAASTSLQHGSIMFHSDRVHRHTSSLLKPNTVTQGAV